MYGFGAPHRNGLDGKCFLAQMCNSVSLLLFQSISNKPARAFVGSEQPCAPPYACCAGERRVAYCSSALTALYVAALRTGAQTS